MEPISWQSTIVAISILVLLAAVTIVTLLRYPNVDSSLKVITAFSGILGTAIGAIMTYFFTREPIAQIQRQATAYEARAVAAEKKLAAVQSSASQFVFSVKNSPDDTSLRMFKTGQPFMSFEKDVNGLGAVGGYKELPK
jgi:hypothetical protein